MNRGTRGGKQEHVRLGFRGREGEGSHRRVGWSQETRAMHEDVSVCLGKSAGRNQQGHDVSVLFRNKGRS